MFLITRSTFEYTENSFRNVRWFMEYTLDEVADEKQFDSYFGRTTVCARAKAANPLVIARFGDDQTKDVLDDDDAMMFYRLKSAYSNAVVWGNCFTPLHHEERENDDGFEVLVVVLSSWMLCERVFVISKAVSKAVSEARRFSIACERKKKNQCFQSRQGG